MADEKITIDLLINSANSAQTLGEVKKSIKDITKELQNTAVGTAEYNKLAIALGKSKAEFMDFKQQIKAFDPDAKFGAFAKIGSGIAGSFQAATGAMALFGVESEEVQKTLLKVQAATALAQGIKEVEGLKDAFVNFNAVVKANPILFIVGAFITLGGIIGGLVAKYGDWRSEEEKIRDSALERLEIEKEDIKIVDAKTNQLKLQGKTEKEILGFKIKETDEAIVQAKIALEQQMIIAKQQVETAQRNKDILSGILRFITAPITWILEAYDYITGNESAKKFSDAVAGFFFDPEETKNKAIEEIKTQKDALNVLVEQRAGYQIAVNKIDEDAYKKAQELKEKIRQEEIEYNKNRLEEQAPPDVKQNPEYTAEEELLNAKLEANYDYLEQKTYIDEEELKSAEKLAEGKKMLKEQELSITSGVLGALRDLADTYGLLDQKRAKKAFEVSKILSIAQTGISTIEAAQNAFKSAALSPITSVFPAYPYIQKGLAYAQGLLAIAKIRSQKFSGGSLGGDGGGGGGGTGGNGVPLNPVTNNSTLLNPDGTPVNNNPNKNPVKAYVVETEITQSQNKIKSIENKSKFE